MTHLARTLLTLAAGLCLSLPASAAEHVVRMLNIGSDGATMVFEPAFVHAEVGDSVRFEPASSGHYLRSLTTPDGVTPWNSTEDQPFTVTLQQPGLYFYICPPHLRMGMIGLLQVGEAVNKQAASDRMQAQKGRMYSNSQRIDELLAKVR